MNERLLDDVKRYTQRGLTQTAVERKLVTKGWHPNEIHQVWVELKKQPRQHHKRSFLQMFLPPEKTKFWAPFLFRLGFSGVFLINALVAWLQPQDFLNLMNKSLALTWLGNRAWLIPVIAINDFALGLIVLFAPKRYRPYVYAWAGLWFLSISLVKFTALNVFAP